MLAVAACLLLAAQPAGAQEDTERRERLTERPDKLSPEPFSIDIAGRPLTLRAEIGVEADFLRRPNRSVIKAELEADAFYSFGDPLSLFAQIRAVAEKRQPDSLRYLERGEMWLHSKDIGGSGLSIDAGRVHFEDDRRWWWDTELDAVRATWEASPVEFSLALAREVGPSRSDRRFVVPEHDSVRRIFAGASWDWHSKHVAQAFFLRHFDRSPPGAAPQLAPRRQDDLDARLSWAGVRFAGAFEPRTTYSLGYWLDAARVRGDERVLESGARRVNGSAVDAGINWQRAAAPRPRLYVGYAVGSRDFRQTGLHANEADLGGSQRFAHYGALLNPELSNLQILTIGAGRSLAQSSSMDLVFHRYRQVKPASVLRDAQLTTELTGEHRDIGSEVDAVLAIEEWPRFRLELIASAFRAGRAFGAQDGKWSYRGFLAARFAF